MDLTVTLGSGTLLNATLALINAVVASLRRSKVLVGAVIGISPVLFIRIDSLKIADAFGITVSELMEDV